MNLKFEVYVSMRKFNLDQFFLIFYIYKNSKYCDSTEYWSQYTSDISGVTSFDEVLT